jgi:hypothetical protein
MKTTFALMAALVAVPAVAEADHFEKTAPSLESVLARGRQADKPILLDFSTVW